MISEPSEGLVVKQNNNVAWNIFGWRWGMKIKIKNRMKLVSEYLLWWHTIEFRIHAVILRSTYCTAVGLRLP